MFGGSGADEVKSMVADAQGRLILTGYTLSPNFPVSAGAVAATPPGSMGNAFVTRLELNKPGTVDYSTYLGGSGGDVGYGVAVDAAGNILVTGYTLSPDFPVTPDATQPVYTGGANAFFTVINPAAGVRFSTYLGQGAGIHTGYAVAAGLNGRFYVGGSAAAAKVPVTEGAYSAAFAGGYTDGFLMAFDGYQQGRLRQDPAPSGGTGGQVSRTLSPARSSSAGGH